MTTIFLLPGDRLCNAFGLRGESGHRQVIRSYLNMIIWGAICIAIALKIWLCRARLENCK